MSYAYWLSKDLKEDFVNRSGDYPADYSEIVNRFVSKAHEFRTSKILESFSKNGYDAFSMEFIERLCTIILIPRPKFTQVDRRLLKQKLNKATSGIDDITEVLNELDLDENLALRISQMFPGVAVNLEVDKVWSFLDLLNCEKERLESIKNEDPLDPSPGANETLSQRVYFVRRLYLDFIDHFDKPMISVITRLTKIVLDDDVAETTVAGIIDRYKSKNNSLNLQSKQNHHSQFFPRKVQPKETVSGVIRRNPTVRSYASATTRGAQIRELAKGGNRASQIADELGITVERIRFLARQEGITLPDAAIGKERSLNPNRIINETVTILQGCSAGIKLLENCIDRIDLDPEWLDQMEESLKDINWLHKTLKEIDR